MSLTTCILSARIAYSDAYSAPAYSGGLAVVTLNGNPFSSTPYGPVTGGYGATCSGKSKKSATCSGQITTVFTWSGPTPAPPANSVIVTETSAVSCQATCTGYQANGDPSAACADGMGNTGVITTTYTQSSGQKSGSLSTTRYSVQGGSSITLNCSPSASMTVPNGPTGSASVAYSAAVSPVTISFIGTTKDSSGNDNILVGQGCTARINGLPSFPDGSGGKITYAWSVSGTTFQDWESTTPAFPNATPPTPANSQASYFLGGPIPATNPTKWYWNDPNQATETISCTATVTPPTGQGSAFSVTAKQKVTVYLPTWTATGIGGYMQVNKFAPGLGGDIGLYAGPTDPMVDHHQPGGINFQATSTTPTQFGKGTVVLAQLATPNLSYITNTIPGIQHTDPENGKIGLDTHYPKSSGPAYVEGGTLYVSNDSPGLDLIYFNAGSAIEKHQFIDYLMYLPPGNDIRPIALAQFSWGTDGSATIPTTGGWAGYVTQNGSDYAGTMTPTTLTSFTGVYGPDFFPSWTRINIFPEF